jgi:hypothetical protein
MQLKISNTDGTFLYSDDVVSFETTSDGRITDVTYGATAVTAIAQFTDDATTAKYEIGILNKGGFFDVWFDNR